MVLSKEPCLVHLFFAIYIDDLLHKLNSSKQGCHIGHLSASAFGYADDIIILSPTCKALRVLINICEVYANEHYIKFNPDKCTLLIFCDLSESDFYYENVNISIAGCTIKNVRSEKHLGHVFRNSNHIVDFSEVIKDIKVRSNVITNQFKPIAWQGKATLFMSQCSSFYGCHLWSLDDSRIKDVYTAWHVSCRRVLGLDARTRTYLLSHLLKSMSIENLISHRMSCFFVNGMQHTNPIIKGFFYNVLVSNCSSMLRNINTILDKISFKYSDFLLINKNELKKEFRKTEPMSDWRVHIIEELLNIRDNQLEYNLNRNETIDLLRYISTFR